MNRTFRAITLAAAAALVSVLAVACGDSSDTEAGLSRAEVERMIESAIADVPHPDHDVSDMERMIESAIADIPHPDHDVSDMERMIESAIADVPHPDHDVSDMERMIESAIAEIPPPVPFAPGLTSADVERIVRAAMADIPQPPAPEAGLTRAEVEEIARAAMPIVPPPLPPEPSLSASEVEEIARGVVASIPYRSNPAAYTKHFVDVAIARYEANGLEATLAYYDTRDSVDGQWYVFVLDEAGEVIGHYDQAVRGRNLNGSLGTDATGYTFGPDMLAADEDGKWVSYIFNNPETGQLESKHSWVVRHDGLLFGSGWYTDPATYTKFFVANAIELYETEGLEAAIEYYNDPENIDGQWYGGILDGDGVSLAHYDPAVRGQNVATGPIGTDATGYDFGSEILTAGESGKWISYVYNNPATEELASKHTWVVRYDGLLFGSGWYADPASYTKFFVDEAIALYEDEGLEAALDYYNTEDSLDGRWYAFILDEDGVIIGHYNPEVRGQNITGPIGTDVTGHEFGSEFVSADENGKWVSYVFTDPVTGEPASKHSWLIRRDGLLFGSGWYTDPASYTQHVVNEAIERYESEGLDATVAYYSDPDNVDGQWYGVIMDSDGTLLAHYNEKIVGQSGLGPAGTDVTGYDFAADMLKATEEGSWVEFVFRHPVTGKQEGKRSWVVRHDGLFFTSGWYMAAPDGDADPGAFAKWFVNQALGYYVENGREATLAHYNTADSMDGDWYVFVLEDRDGALYTIAHASRPELVGTTRDRIDANGFDYGAAFAAVTESGGGEWISYLFTHPTTREDTPKHTWVERRDDLLFGAGWYEK